MRLLFITLAMLTGQQLLSQCPFTPTITGDSLVCGGTFTTFSTQEFDTYQWYRRPYGSTGQPELIPGATQQTYVANADTEGVHYFSVEVTKNGCTERSAELLLDIIVYSPLVVEILGSFSVGSNGETLICTGQPAWFSVFTAYGNVQWLRNGAPLAGETGDSLLITQPGVYNLTAVSAICPNSDPVYGLDLEVQWSSAPGCTPSSVEQPGLTPVLVQVMPNPATDQIVVRGAAHLRFDAQLLDSRGQLVWSGNNLPEMTTIPTTAMAAGVYHLVVVSPVGNQTVRVVIR
jgi:hypothetical protein